MAAVGTRGTVDAVGAEVQQLLGLSHPERAGLGPGVADEALKALAVLRGPLALRVLVDELRPVAGEAVVEDVQPDDHLHPQLVPVADEHLRRVEGLEHLGVPGIPRDVALDVLVEVPDDGAIGPMRPGVLDVEADGVAQLRPVGEIP